MGYKVGAKLRQFLRQIESEEANSRNKIHQTWGPLVSPPLNVNFRFQANTYTLTQEEIQEKAALDSLQYGPYGLCFYFYATRGSMPESCREEGVDFATGDLSDYTPEARKGDPEFLEKLEVTGNNFEIEIPNKS